MPPSGCPVCGYPSYREFEAAGAVSYDICPCCSFQSGVDGIAWDRTERNETFRQRWIEAGAHWWSKTTPQPPGWSAEAQLRAAAFAEAPDEDP